MKICWCRALLSLAIIVFAWWLVYSWSIWVITLAAAILFVMSLNYEKCCCRACGVKKEEEPKTE